MRAKLKQSFSEQVPDTSDYQVGYFEKRHNRKHFLTPAATMPHSLWARITFREVTGPDPDGIVAGGLKV